ncbi:CHAT domain-containing protein [Microcoleus sp. FACHB-672]|uniref:CHAT domain-containing protein n=1 Tax=Microcoleus sp. FACHB-672 TaxID=2692825 RepID=UPI00168288AC|nr:CHAT domain-containing tetratricopeptide repeat protein [Microcoleus sp. FACHB-672]
MLNQIKANYAKVYAALGQYDQALEIAQTIEKTGQWNQAQETIALVYAKAGQYEKAFQILQPIASSIPYRGVPEIARYAAEAGQYSLFLKTVQANNLNDDELSKIVSTYKELGQYEQAFIVIQTIRSNYLRASKLIQLARTYIQAGQQNKADEILSTALPLIPTLEENQSETHGLLDALLGLVSTYIHTGQPKKVDELLSVALKLAQTIKNNQSQSKALSQVALEYARIKQYDQSLEIILAIDNSNTTYSVEVIKQFLKAGLDDKALEIGKHIFHKTESNGTQLISQIGFLTDIVTAYSEQRVYEPVFYSRVLQITQSYSSQNTHILGKIAAAYAKAKQEEKAFDIVKSIANIEERAFFLAGLAVAYAQVGEYEKAFDIVQTIEKDSTQGWVAPYIFAKNKALFGIAVSYIEAGLYDKALAVATNIQGRRLVDSLGRADQASATLSIIAQEYIQAGQYNYALQISKAITDNPIESVSSKWHALEVIAHSYVESGQYDQALKIAQTIADATKKTQVLDYIANRAARRGKLSLALQIVQTIEDSDKRADGLVLIARKYADAGQYNQALQVAQTIENCFNRVNVLLEIASQYANAGQKIQATDLLAQLPQFQDFAVVNSRPREDEASELQRQGDAQREVGKFEAALQSYQQALNIYREIGDRQEQIWTLRGMVWVYQSMAEVYAERGDTAKVIDFHQQRLAIYRELGQPVEEIYTLVDLGKVYASQGDNAKASDYYLQSWAILRRYKNPQEIASEASQEISASLLWWFLGRTLFESGHLAAAKEALLADIQYQESRLTSFPGNDATRVKLTDELFSTSYQLLQRIFVAQGQVEAALEMAERGRSRAFVQLLAERLARSEKQPTEVINRVSTSPPTIEQIRQVAKEQNATLVEHSIVDEQLYIWSIKPTGEVGFSQVDLKSLGISLQDLVTSSRESIGVRGRSLEISFDPGLNQTEGLQQLHKLLIEPIAQYLPTEPNDRLIFIPQNELFLVPFPALQDASGKYLIEKHTILTAPSIQVLQLTHEKRQAVSGKEVLVVGNPTMPSLTTELGKPSQMLFSLPGAEKEATAIAQLLKTKALTGNQATKAAVLLKLSNARIIHLATHGLLDDLTGMGVPGAIALAPDGTRELNDGLLTSSEILNMDLNAELVVLSACDTGRGKLTGDGVIGLSRSLITAGVPSVIVSLWSVPDAPTAFLMTQFYQNLQTNPDKAQMLRQAMLTTMKNHPNPRDWAAFTLIGEAQ